MSPLYRVRVYVREVNENCAMGYKLGDCFTVERFYIPEVGKGVCIRALISMPTPLSSPPQRSISKSSWHK